MLRGVDDLYRICGEKGARFIEPTNKPWGLREFGLSTRTDTELCVAKQSERILRVCEGIRHGNWLVSDLV